MQSNVKRTVQMILIAIVATAGLGTAASPASASSGQCPASTFCTWNGINWSGTPAWSQSVSSSRGACYNISAINGANNNAESLYNREAFPITVYSNANGSGFMFVLAAGAGESNLSVHPAPGGWQNIASSVCHD